MASAFLSRDNNVLDAVGIAVAVSMPEVPGSSSMSEKKVLQSIMMFAQYCEGETKLNYIYVCMCCIYVLYLNKNQFAQFLLPCLPLYLSFSLLLL